MRRECTTLRSRSRLRAGQRHGVAVSELAVCLPVIVLLTIATIESSSALYVRQSVAIAAYEAARVALIPGAVDSNVMAQAQILLDERRVKNATVQITPSVAAAAPGTFIAVSIAAPCAENLVIPGMFFRNKSVHSRVEMMKEQ